MDRIYSEQEIDVKSHPVQKLNQIITGKLREIGAKEYLETAVPEDGKFREFLEEEARDRADKYIYDKVVGDGKYPPKQKLIEISNKDERGEYEDKWTDFLRSIESDTPDQTMIDRLDEIYKFWDTKDKRTITILPTLPTTPDNQ